MATVSPWRQLALLLWVSSVLIGCVGVFLNGFLLRRDALPDRAVCTHGLGADRLNAQVCTNTANRVVLLIIDALKYEFTEFDPGRKQPLAFENKMPVFSELLRKHPNNSRLFRFVADPPTTTMQRLKGLTTGSLPTFVDAGANFASSEIDEDNFVDQVARSGKRIVFIGDDTWVSLYPDRFLRQFPYPSFNVWDLDTVDNGVVAHLEPELRKRDADLVIGHLLGVDHCGHRHGPDHPEMTRKLTEMDIYIRDIASKLEDDTVLVVIGDHGMTDTGNHGGDSDAEVTAAMFVYSPHRPLFPVTAPGQPDAVAQVDLAPTLSALLGVAVPFANLGAVVSEALPLAETEWPHLLAALKSNVEQVHHYVTTYARASPGHLSESALEQLELRHIQLLNQADGVRSLEDLHHYQVEALSYLRAVKAMCEKVWVQFNMTTMLTGVALMTTALVGLFVLLQAVPAAKIESATSTKRFIISWALAIFAAGVGWLLLTAPLECYCIVSLLLLGLFLKAHASDIRSWWRSLRGNGSDWLLLVVVAVSVLGQGSDNFIINEGLAASVLLTAVLGGLCLGWKEGRRKRAFQGLCSRERLMLAAVAALMTVVLRCLPAYWQCREEQAWCENVPTATDDSRGVALLPILALTLPFLATWRWLKTGGHLVSGSVSAWTAVKLPALVACLTGIFWLLESLPAAIFRKTIGTWDPQLLPLLAFLCIFICLVCLFADPLLVHVIDPTQQRLRASADDDLRHLVPYLYHQVKQALNKSRQGAKDACAVYGLPSVFSAASLALVLPLLQLLSLLQGSAASPALALVFFGTLMLLTTLAIARLNSVLLPGQLLYVPWVSVVSWALFSVVGFHGTGQNTTFPGIKWQAAFVGTSGRFSSNFLPGLMVSASTFAAPLIMGVALPLLLVAPLTALSIRPSFAAQPDIRVKAGNGEVFLYEKASLTASGIFLLCAKYILYQAFRTLGSVATALVLRRHLMVWRVFAPKVIFEAASLSVSIVAVLLGFAFFSLVAARLQKLMARLEERQAAV